MESNEKEIQNSESMISVLDAIYQKALGGIPMVSKSVDDLANNYLSKHSTVESASKSLIHNQVVKCGTSGFVTGLGGIITLVYTLPANVTSVLYVQLRMIAALAEMGGFDPTADQVRTLVYVCLTGTAAADIMKNTGIKFGEKFAVKMIEKIPAKVLTQINQKVGMRFITKFGEKGIINLGKTVPLVGGIIGGGLDIASTKIIGNNAYKMFIEKKDL